MTKKRLSRRFAWTTAAVVALGGAIAAFALLAGGSASADDLPATATRVVTATPTLQPTSTPVKPQAKPTPPPVQPRVLPPFGPLAADPVRVYTGDGDCLNVRPQPGTTFQVDPRACVPEGFLLWLHGPALQVDGETWRYALGEGWVATRYVKPDAQVATSPSVPYKSVRVTQADGVATHLAEVSASGQVASFATLPYVPQGLGAEPARFSPSGRYIAYSREEDYIPTLTIQAIASGEVQKFPRAHIVTWGPGDRMLLRSSPQCPQSCAWVTAWLDPAEGIVHTVDHAPNAWASLAWLPDGGSFIAFTNERAVLRVHLDGRIETVANPLPEGTFYGDISVSPDGTRLLSGATLGPIKVLDLRSGEVTEVQRAQQLPSGGRCGGATGRLSAWLDDTTWSGTSPTRRKATTASPSRRSTADPAACCPSSASRASPSSTATPSPSQPPKPSATGACRSPGCSTSARAKPGQSRSAIHQPGFAEAIARTPASARTARWLPTGRRCIPSAACRCAIAGR